MQTGGVAAAHAPAPPNGYGSPQQQQQQQQLHQQQQQMLLQQHNQQQQLSSNSPASTAATGTATTNKILVNGGRFDFDDGGTYCGGWEDGKAHGHGVCTGPKGQGAYSGSWHYGFEVSGVYMWPSGNTFEGQWQNGKRHGLGVESRGRWLYRGEWTQGFKGRYGVRQSATTNAKYEGTWANGLQDGYGSETYADGGTFQGQWMRGMRHGYGVRTSARFGMASHSKPNKSDIRNSLSSLGSDDAHNKVGSTSEDPVIGSEGRDKKLDDTRGGFVLKANSDEQPNKRKTLVSKSTHSLKRTFMSGFKMRKQRSTGELEKKVSGSIRSTASCTSWISTGSSQSAMGESYNTDSNASFIVEDEHMDVNTTETYVGEWKNDKRSGYGIAERTDGLKYEGEWFANKKYGYGVTTFKDGTKEEGKYKNNVLITSQKKKHYFLMRSAKLKERIEASVNAAHRASKIALQKADIAISRMATARGKAELSDIAADHAREDYEIAKLTAKQFAPDFIQPGLEKTRLREILKQRLSIDQKSILQPLISTPNPAGPAQFSPDVADVASLSLSTNNLLYTATGGGQQQDAAETTPQFRPRSHYAQPYYQSTGGVGGGGGGTHQQQQQQSGGVSPQQSHMGNIFSRNSITPETRQNQNSSGSSNRTYGRPANNGIAPESIPRRPYVTHNDVGVGTESTGNVGNAGSAGSAPTTARQSAPMDRASFSQQRVPSTSSRAGNEDGGMSGKGASSSSAATAAAVAARRDSACNRLNHYNQYEVGPDYDTDPSLLRRNAKYVDREALFSFQQAMSDHFDHYKRPPSRDNSVDRYNRAASRLSGGSRQSSVEKSQNQQQQRRGGDDRIPSSSSSAADKSFNGAAGFTAPSMSGAMQNVPSSSTMQRQPPFEEIILRQRNLGQEIVPSPIGQPKRTESLYVNPNTARKETKPKVSTTSTRITSRRDSIKNADDYNSYYGSVGGGGSNYNYRNRRDDSNIDYAFYDYRSSVRNSSASVDDDYDYTYGYDHETRGTNDFHTKASTSSASRSIRDIDNDRAFVGIVDSIPIRGNSVSSDGSKTKISGYPYASSRYSDDGRSRSSSSNACNNGFLCVNKGARGIGIGRSSSCSSNANCNRIVGDNHTIKRRGHRCQSSISSSKSLDRSNNGDYHARANAEGYASGNSRGVIPRSIMRSSKDSKRRRKKGLRVRFSDEVNNGDDHDDRGSELDRGYDRIRSGGHSSHLNSDNSNRVRTSGSVDRKSRNTDNIQIGSRGNNSNYGSGNGRTRGNIDNYANISETQSRFGGYGNCEICSRSEVREVDVLHSRSSIVDIDEGHLINNIYNDGGIVVNSRYDARSAIRNNKREHDNIAVNSSSGIDYDYTDEYAYNGEYDWNNRNSEYNLESGYDYGDDDNESTGSSEEGARGGRRIPRLLPSRPSTNEMEIPVQMALQRKKSLPDVQVPLNAPASITREEVSVLSSARREEMRRMEEENERLRANPLLYLVSPHMKDWFTRQQLVLVILIVNITLALMFFKLLTS